MGNQLYWNTVSPLLKEVLLDLMNEKIFNPFRLVGGTALSLQFGHRMSVDIDLFTGDDYGSVNFSLVKQFLKHKYQYYESSNIKLVGIGTYFKVGNSKSDFVKIDAFYNEPYIFDEIKNENIRMASDKEIIAMKLDVLLRGGRKKDFWDLHYFLDKYTIDEMINFHEKRYPYNDIANLKSQFINFDNAENDVEPICLLNKSWELIKLDFYEKLNS
jgi:predicted nucleotidyltransferase component of viral defense system